MAFTEKTEYKVEVLNNRALQIRRADIVLKDGVEVGRTYHRHCIHPGDDYSGETEVVRQIAGATWTPEVISAYQANLANAINPPIGEV